MRNHKLAIDVLRKELHAHEQEIERIIPLHDTATLFEIILRVHEIQYTIAFLEKQ